MSKLKLLQTLTVAPYTTRIMTQASVRPVYYNVNRKRKGKVPPGMMKRLRAGKLTKDNKGFVLRDGEKILANPRTAGKPKFITIAGNQFTSGFANFGHRNAVVVQLKDYLRPYVEQQLAPFDDFPLYVTFTLYMCMDGQDAFDLSNLWFWSKYMEDILFEPELGIIPDDEWKDIHLTW